MSRWAYRNPKALERSDAYIVLAGLMGPPPQRENADDSSRHEPAYELHQQEHRAE